MKQIFFLLSLFFMVSCSNDDTDPCSVGVLDTSTDIGLQNLFIELVDTEGNNLIENGTYSANDISISYNNSIITGVVFQQVQSIQYFIIMNIFGQEGDNIFLINLNDTETDTLILNLSIEPGDLCLPDFRKLNAVTYNEIEQNIEDFEGENKITVIKP
ncbi:hypothetical protein [Aquimarina sp. MMG016]|uniref:hypothetical protein n=1 Tax=Aquimarina sp. MMG016 TaxID=2822690 RepID=UPI001B39EDD3|nr:hypothetical protein [Aquimarina sp. MMG016]MBQ4820922.1 hypothetical protein [Aquimarina sp. MMG016]